MDGNMDGNIVCYDIFSYIMYIHQKKHIWDEMENQLTNLKTDPSAVHFSGLLRGSAPAQSCQ